MPIKLLIAFLVVAVLLLPARRGGASMQVEPTPEQKAHCMQIADGRCHMVYSVRALKFPDTAQELGLFTNTARMGIFKPAGPGPFPAILILHSCEAVDFDQEHINTWVSRAVKDGYVAFVLDSWGQRGIPELCQRAPRDFPPFLSIHLDVRVRDAYEALAHLEKFSFVDTRRVGAVGFSNGGRTAYLLGSAHMAKKYARGLHQFAAVAGVYGKCSVMQSDVDRPLLALLGERDEDGDPKVCVPMLTGMKNLGAPVDWHVYPGIGHAWDSPKFTRPTRVSYLGNQAGVLFAYDRRAAEDSRERVFKFFAQHLGTR